MGNLCGKLFMNTHAGKQRADPPIQILGGYRFLNNKKFIDDNMIRNYLNLNLLVLKKTWNVSFLVGFLMTTGTRCYPGTGGNLQLYQ